MAAVTPGTELVELATGVYARLHEGLTNAGVIVGDDEIPVIDSPRVPSFRPLRPRLPRTSARKA